VVAPLALSVQPVVYVLHLHEPIGQKQHYVGWTKRLAHRLCDHRAGYKGIAAGLTRTAKLRGIEWTLALVVTPASQADERAVKRVTRAHFCPMCGGDPDVLREHVRGSLLVLPRVSVPPPGVRYHPERRLLRPAD